MVYEQPFRMFIWCAVQFKKTRNCGNAGKNETFGGHWPMLATFLLAFWHSEIDDIGTSACVSHIDLEFLKPIKILV